MPETPWEDYDFRAEARAAKPEPIANGPMCKKCTKRPLDENSTHRCTECQFEHRMQQRKAFGYKGKYKTRYK